eukprot:TRINITY_DN6751_c0_g1_i1.p2 TRINITY_DN6751_c0_g1~~TRINITY_DN6751_c0_g1_i1.p2  ORF type:complete len:113 (-),score=2.41 TRINITY_DN6751_c0_g1_i1:57-395(-)
MGRWMGGGRGGKIFFGHPQSHLVWWSGLKQKKKNKKNLCGRGGERERGRNTTLREKDITKGGAEGHQRGRWWGRGSPPPPLPERPEKQNNVSFQSIEVHKKTGVFLWGDMRG